MDDKFELSILDSGDPTRVIAVARRGYDLAIEPLACSTLQDLVNFRTRLVAAAHGESRRPSSADLAQFGLMLFDFTIRKKIKTIYDRLPSSHIRIHIHSNHAELQSLPWEYFQQPDTPPGPNTSRSVVRVVPTIGVELPAPIKFGKKVRILFVYADPIDQGAVGWKDIKASIESEFNARMKDLLILEVVEGATRESLLDAINGGTYDVFHFVGHGRVIANGVGQLLLKHQKTKKSDPIDATELGIVLKNRGLSLTMLSSCSTAAGDFSTPFAVISKTLVECGMPAVVANQFPITNSVAAIFSSDFYKALIRDGDIDKAMTSGRVRLAIGKAASGGEAQIEWGIPTLFRHAGADRLFIS